MKKKINFKKIETGIVLIVIILTSFTITVIADISKNKTILTDETGTHVFITSQLDPLEADANGPYEGIDGEPIQFTGNATGGTLPYNWSWDFGDDNESTEQNPTHAYQKSGNYTVTLTVKDDEFNTANDTTYAIVVSQQPPPPIPRIQKIFGGIAKIHADIQNTDKSRNMYNVKCSITVLSIFRIITIDEIIIPIIKPGETHTITTNSTIFGLGPIQVIVKADNDSATATKNGNGWIFIIFVKIRE